MLLFLGALLLYCGGVCTVEEAAGLVQMVYLAVAVVVWAAGEVDRAREKRNVRSSYYTKSIGVGVGGTEAHRKARTCRRRMTLRG